MANRLIAGQTHRTPAKKAKILDAMARGLTLSEAATAAGMCRGTVWLWRKDDPEFAKEFEAAFDAGTDTFVQEAKRRAFSGSDTLLIFLLKSRKPEVFNRRMLDVTNETNINVTATNEVVHFYMPPNGRDQPEQTITLDGEVIPEEVQARLKAIMEPQPKPSAPQPQAPGMATSSWARIAKG